MTLRVAASCIIASIIGGALVLASCGHASLPAPPQSRQSLERVRFHVVVPTPPPSTALAHLAAHDVHVLYVSSQTTQAGVTVTPDGGVPYPAVYFACTSTSCSGAVDAPVGDDTFSVSLYAGTRISSDTLLSSGSTAAAIAAGTTNVVNVTFDPVVSSIALSVLPSTMIAGTAGSATVSIDAMDAGSATIIGPGTYINSDGNALTIDLTNVDKLLNGSVGHSTTLSSTSISGPPASGPTQVTLNYDGNPDLAHTTIDATTSAPINGSIQNATLVVGASPSPTPTGCHVTQTPNPRITFFTVPPNQLGLQNVGDSIATGPDNNLWTSDGARQALELTTSGRFTVIDVPGASALSLINTMVAGPAGGDTVWFADPGLREVGRITIGASPSITMFAPPDIETPNLAEPSAIAPGPDGNMWFDDQGSDYVGKIAPLLGAITEYPYESETGRSSQGLVLLPSGDLWFAESGIGKVGRVSISTLTTGSANHVTELVVPLARSSDLRNIAADPNGNVWITLPKADKIARINVTASPVTIDEFSLKTAGATPYSIEPGPDGAMWFTELTGKRLGRIAYDAVLGTAPTEFKYSFAAPAGITTGPDCDLWVTDEAATGRIGRVQF